MVKSNDTSIPRELLQLYDLANTQVWRLYTNFFSLAVESALFGMQMSISYSYQTSRSRSVSRPITALSTASFIVSTHLLRWAGATLFTIVFH